MPGTELGDTGVLGERFIDNQRVEGTIEQMLAGTINFLKRNMKNSVIINDDGKRSDRTEYPIEALREAIANALIHRDYSTQTENAYISVYMYTNRIEIINPGALYGTNRIEKLGTATTMESRNPTLVRILEEKGSVIENRHSGIPTMIREMEKYGLPKPEFYEERDSFKVIFRNNCVAIEDATQSATQNATVKIRPKHDYEELKRKVLEFCKEARTSEEIREHINIDSKSLLSRNIIRPLILSGKLKYTNKNSVNARNQKYKSL